MTDTPDQEPPAPAEPTPSAPPPPASPMRLDRRSMFLIGVAVALAIALGAFAYFSRSQAPPQQTAEQAAPGQVADEQFYPDYDGPLLVRPSSIGRPLLSDAMRGTMISGYADLEFTVAASGEAENVHVVRQSVNDIGYGAEAVRVVRGATWPTEWQGRTAPYEARYRVIFPPGRSGGRAIAPLSIASPNLSPEILALRRNVSVTLLVRVNEDGSVDSASVVSADVQNSAVQAEAMRVATGARFPPNPAGFAYQTELVIPFNIVSAQQPNEPPPGPSVSLAEVPFAQRPGADDFDRYYPRRARRDGIEGRVELSCNVRGDRRLVCAIVSEDPPGQGFGQAGMRIARAFRAQAQFPDGRSTIGANVRVPLVFKLD